jgi:SAM-dependent methyltransferase
MNKIYRINIGCGRSPTEGWLNMDNSVSLKLAALPWLMALAQRLRLLVPAQVENLAYNRKYRIVFCDARKRIPVPDKSADVVYTSHMVEHLDREEAAQFFREARRVLCPGGTLRIAVPNLRRHVDNYLNSGDADELMKATNLGRRLPKSLLERIKVFFLGERQFHVFMYDPLSLSRFLEAEGFTSVTPLPAGETRILSPGALDLSERSPESLFVEGLNP